MRARTMVYLDSEQLQALKDRARAQRISLAELMRRVVKRSLEESGAQPPVSPQAYRKIVGIGSSRKRDISERHDAYLGEALRREHDR